MHILKFEVENKDGIYSVLTKKYNVIDYLYPIDVYKRGKFYFILGLHLLDGEASEKDKFCRALKKTKEVIKFEKYEDHVITLIKEQELFYDQIYNPELFHPSPAIIQKGIEKWTVGSWDRENLSKVLSSLEKEKKKFSNLRLDKFGKLKLDEIYFPKLLPKMSSQQKIAFQLALANGYYGYPRKKDLKDLAKIMGVSISTYQEHLRRAEEKLMPLLGNSLKTSIGKND
ncbi:MAG: helix-turn-helix domain-containing protein [archaeon]